MTGSMSSAGTRTCRCCGKQLMTGFAACGACGAAYRAVLPRVGQAAAESFRYRQQEMKTTGLARRKLIAVTLVAASLIGASIFYGPGFLTLCVAANRPLVNNPITLADDYNNAKVHAARRALYLE